MVKKKNYVLDTNLLLDNPNVIYGFEDNNVYITGTTLQELDKHKKDRGERGFNARETGRILDAYREKYKDLKNGVPMPNGGTLYTLPNGVDEKLLPKGFSIADGDNRIISACISLANEKKDEKTILLSNDTYMRLNASTCGVEVQAVRNDRIEDSNYTGHRYINVQNYEIIQTLYSNGFINSDIVKREMRDDEMELTMNEFLTIKCGEQASVLTIYKGDVIQTISIKGQRIYGGIEPRNVLQTYALWALLNPELDLVILKGPAGTAKTFLSLAAGLTQSCLGQKCPDDVYQQILISRPNVEGSDPGFGYLPGDLDEKMAPLLASYRDNLENLMGGNIRTPRERIDLQRQIDDLFMTGSIDICPLNYIRGRSLKNRYMICDEAQNANSQLIKAVVTRAGTGTKIVVAGDPDQCDAPNIDKYTNGLVYLSETMKGAPNTAIIKFGEEQCERSNLAKIAIERMRR